MEPGILEGVTSSAAIDRGAYIITGARTLVIIQFTNLVVIVVVVVVKGRTWNGPEKASLKQLYTVA